MVKLFKAELTGTGRPVLLRGEVERGMLDKVGGQAGGWAGGGSNWLFCRWPWSFTPLPLPFSAAGGSRVLRQRRRKWI
jgi:hypothetical protein